MPLQLRIGHSLSLSRFLFGISVLYMLCWCAGVFSSLLSRDPADRFQQLQMEKQREQQGGQEQGGMKMCNSTFDTWMNKMCTFDGEANSCLKNEVRLEDRMRSTCCEKGCKLGELKQLCCFTEACLAQCYPGKNYKVGTVY